MSDILHPSNSPITLQAGRGVRRLNRVPLIIVFGLCAVVALAVIYTFHERIQNEQARVAAATTTTPQAGSPTAALAHAPQSGLIASSQRSPSPPQHPTQTSHPDPVGQGQLQEWKAYEQRKQEIEQAHYQALVTAIGASPDVRVTGSSWSAEASISTQVAQADGDPVPAIAGPPGTVPEVSQPVQTAANPAPAAATPLDRPASTPNTTQPSAMAGPGGTTFVPTGGLFGGGLLGSGELGIPPANPNANDQIGKRNFLAQSGSTSSGDYLQARITSPVSPYEVKAGSVIPATMIGGINSDLPGQIIAQVRENVYNTATGRYLLIPQGSRLVGVYSSAVTYGQSRLLVAWNRIIYPNGESLDLGAMPGADQGGYAGFNDLVDNHYLRIFGSAILASVFSAGAQLSQPQNSNGTITSSQILAASLGQQANNVGAMLIARGLDIQPTLKIRNGYLFNVMVTKDMVLQPWNGMQPLPYGAPGRN